MAKLALMMDWKTMNKLPWKSRSLAVVIAAAIAAPALAQSGGELDLRLRKLESEVSALQRVVFPGGDGRFFPQQQPGQPSSIAPGSPASAPSAEMLTRMDSLEGQVARLTAQVEEDHNKLEKMEVRITALEAADKALVAAPAPAPSPAATKPPVAKPGPVAADPPAKRLAAVRAVEKPKTKDAGDDEYSYGYRLWEANFFPESEQQLKLFLQKYPKHPRTSYARNLLGRNYLDDNNAHEAAGWFLQNYKLEPKGDRAPDSLLYLAESMRRLGDTKRGCVALQQFSSTFPAEAAGRLRTPYEATRSGLKCN